MLTIYINNDVEFHVDMHKIEPNANRHGGTTGLKIVRSEYRKYRKYRHSLSACSIVELIVSIG